MRIAMIGQKGIPARFGGVERHVEDLSIGLVQAGHEVTVYSRPWYTGETKDDVQGVRVLALSSLHTKHFDAITHTLFATLHALRQDYDVIHYHGVGPSLLSWIPRLFRPKVLVVTTFHSIDRHHQKWNRLAKWCLRLGEWAACSFAHKTIAVSRGLEQYCLNEFNKQTTYIPNGITIPKHRATPLSLPFGLEPQKYLLMVSRLVPHKGAHLLLETFQNLQKKYPENTELQSLKLVIVGGSVYTDAYVEKLHTTANISNNILFTGFLSGEPLEALYEQCLTLVHPSLNEGLPLTVLQAMAHKKPILVSNIPEHMELVSDVRSLFETNNVLALEKAILRFLALSAEEKEKMGEANQHMVSTYYEWGRLLPQIVALYTVAKDIPIKTMARVTSA